MRPLLSTYQSANRFNQLGHISYSRRRLRRILACLIAIDPDAPQAELARRLDVVKPATSNVNPIRKFGARNAKEPVKVPERGLVILNLLSGDDEIERLSKCPLCLSEKIVIAIR
jgi:predicted Zn-ribbon and HTH transcriptional regulator